MEVANHTIDDLQIKLLVNSKKMVKKQDSNNNNSHSKGCLSDKNINKVIAFMEKELMCYSIVQSNFDNFLDFLQRYAPRIVSSFEKTISGKDL